MSCWWRWLVILLVGSALVPARVGAQVCRYSPLMDAAAPDLANPVEPGRPYLLVLREQLRIEPGEPARQAILLRLVGEAVVSAGLLLHGNRLGDAPGGQISLVESTEDALAQSDALWGVPGIDYGHEVPWPRVWGLEGGAGGDACDELRAADVYCVHSNDLHQEEYRDTVQFWLESDGEDRDELRVFVEYPEEPSNTRISLFLVETSEEASLVGVPADWPWSDDVRVMGGANEVGLPATRGLLQYQEPLALDVDRGWSTSCRSTA